jgi:hypothetical protein
MIGHDQHDRDEGEAAGPRPLDTRRERLPEPVEHQQADVGLRRAGQRVMTCRAPSAVMISGAVSPAPRATARMAPVVSPGAAAGSVTLRVVCHWRAPSP